MMPNYRAYIARSLALPIIAAVSLGRPGQSKMAIANRHCHENKFVAEKGLNKSSIQAGEKTFNVLHDTVQLNRMPGGADAAEGAFQDRKCASRLADARAGIAPGSFLTINTQPMMERFFDKPSGGVRVLSPLNRCKIQLRMRDHTKTREELNPNKNVKR